jgi:DNA-binding HxlR family transcriptional regulator
MSAAGMLPAGRSKQYTFNKRNQNRLFSKRKGMKNPIEHLNKVFDSRIRLGIMSALMVNTAINFNELKELIEVTDGNLASHLKTLEENGFIKVQKGFIGRKTNTTYSVTRAGEKAFKQHLDALEQMIKSIN